MLMSQTPGAKTTEGESNTTRSNQGRSKYVYLAAYEDSTDVYTYTIL